MNARALVGMLVVLIAAGGCASTQGGQAGPGTAATLDRIKATKTVTFGYRDSSVPFSFMGSDQKPAGYSVDLCNRVADDLKRDLQMPDLAVKWALVTVENRVASVQNGTIDLECGSTTNTLSRQAQADFSLTTFVTGASLLTLKQTVTANLSGFRIAVIPGTTTERALKDAMDKSSTSAQLVPVKDHSDGRTALENKTADAYASDREILIGLALTAKNPADFALVDRYFSYEPYALMVRRGDPAFHLAVDRVLIRLYRSAEVVPIYEKWFGPFPETGSLIAAVYVLNSVPD